MPEKGLLELLMKKLNFIIRNSVFDIRHSISPLASMNELFAVNGLFGRGEKVHRVRSI